jgi:hypothetical protein
MTCKILNFTFLHWLQPQIMHIHISTTDTSRELLLSNGHGKRRKQLQSKMIRNVIIFIFHLPHFLSLNCSCNAAVDE